MSSTEIICGAQAVREVLRAGKRRCYEIFVAAGKREQSIEEVSALARQKKIPIKELSRDEIAQLARVEKHQGIAARVDPFLYSSLEDILRATSKASHRTFLILDGILDPQNLGSLIRTAHQLGFSGIVLPRDHSAPVGPAATRAAAGATEYVPIIQATNLAQCLTILKKHHFWIYGAWEDASTSLYATEFDAHSAIVLGGEGEGMRRLVREGCDFLISIPMTGQIGSLNVSVAGAIVMAEVRRQLNHSTKT